ncbi:MAG: pre-mycofactocin synthase MftD [Acidimicrobiales bacterium]
MANDWFESIAIAQERAKKRLPKSVYQALIAGAERGSSLESNVASFAELMLLPTVAGAPAERDQSTTVMGQSMSMPVIMSPTGVQAVHPDGEVAVARAAAARGVVMALSSFASKPLDQVIEANPQSFFQMYWAGDRDSISARLDRAKQAGAKGIILTLDWTFTHSRDWGSPDIPSKVGIKTMLKHGPEALMHPKWLAMWARSGHLPSLTTPNFRVDDGAAPGFFEAYGTWMGTPPPTWDDVAWMVDQWGGELMVKGISRVDDAKRCVDVGATALSVSNHGGNNLDGTPAPIRMLPGIADAVGDQIEVVLDGGVRRGSDVVKALAFGAKAVMVGRAYLWGLAANGQGGVENVLDVLRAGTDSTLLGLGKGSIHELSKDDILIPPHFFPTDW